MFRSSQNQSVMWLIVIAILIVILDFTVFNPGLVFLLLNALAFIYFGRKIRNQSFGRLLFWIGVLLVAITILSTFIFKIFLFLMLIFAVYQFIESRRETQYIKPGIKQETINGTNEKVIKKAPLLKNLFAGKQETPNDVYEWNDINIHTGVGDCVIDLSNTVLPEGVSVISIRSFAGNVKILIPYEQEVSIHHSVITGSLNFFEIKETGLINKSINMQTEKYDSALVKVKIITSIIAGKVEVKRI